MRSFIRAYPTETRLFVVLLAISVFLSLVSPNFLTLGNVASLLNNNAVNVIWAVGLLVVLVSGGIDISFAVAASVVQYLSVYAFSAIGGGNWLFGFVIAAALGAAIGFINAGLIHYFRIISIIVTIATYNALFGLLMFLTSGRYLYDLPDWWTNRVVVLHMQTAAGDSGELTLPVAVMIGAMAVTWALIRYTTTGRQLYAFGDNPDGAQRAGVSAAQMRFITVESDL